MFKLAQKLFGIFNFLFFNPPPTQDWKLKPLAVIPRPLLTLSVGELNTRYEVPLHCISFHPNFFFYICVKKTSHISNDFNDEDNQPNNKACVFLV